MLTLGAVSISATGVVVAILITALVFVIGLCLERFGVPIPRPILGIICLAVFVLCLLGNFNLTK